MLTLLLSTVVLLVVVALFVWLLLRKDNLLEAERKAHREEVAKLLDRIQAPEKAPFNPEDWKRTGPHHLPFEDDDAWHKYVETGATS